MNAFKRNLLIGYSVSLFLLIGAGVASYISISNLLSSARLVNHTNEVIKQLEGIILSVKEGEGGQRGYLLTGDNKFLVPFEGAYEKALQGIGAVRKLTMDNQEQQRDGIAVNDLIDQRFAILQKLIDKREKGAQVAPNDLQEGRQVMEKLAILVRQMEAREQSLLSTRTENLNKFAASTPAFILIASLLSVLVTLISFVRVNEDYKKRTGLQQQLLQKDQEMTRRIDIIQNLADKIAGGHYEVRVDDAGKDTLGSLAVSLNKMAGSLDESFKSLSEKEWLQSGIANLNEIMIGEKNLHQLTYNVIEFITAYTQSAVGAFYLAKDERTLTLSSSIALNKESIRKEIRLGEGMAGQSAQSAKEIVWEDVSKADLVIDYTAGSLRPLSVLAIPVFHEKTLKGVIELGSLQKYAAVVHEFLKVAVFNIGMAIHSAKDHQRLQDLLHETQAQSEELQAQHGELENVNAELAAQAEKLQSSEEELRVQQEELQQANQELEERSRLLEEKNEMILERNLQIQDKAEKLELSTRYKSEFLANMSHELRTPLNSILLLSRLLSENHDSNLTTDQIEYAQVIQSSGKGLLLLIDEILDLSKIESGKMQLEFADVSLDTLTHDMHLLFEPMAREKGVAFSIVRAKETRGVIETDRLRLDQILRNLISNALKFTKKGSVALDISPVGEAHMVFRVKDTGIGIPKEKQQTIFEAFQQADGSTRRQYGGTGLGLSISRELAKLLGGEIKLESEEGKGSEFSLILPLHRSAGATAPAMELSSGSPYPVEETSLPEPDKFITPIIPPSIPDDRQKITKEDKVILIIEDDTAFASSLLNYTRAKGYKGLVAVRGDEGIRLAKEYLPLGILLDVQLPVKSGWEVMDELKADIATRPIPVHMMSSFEVKTRSLSKGAVDFINKPVAFEQLGQVFQKIEQALNQYPKKVLIVEENPKHARALAYFLETYNVNAEISASVGEGIHALTSEGADCVILDMGVPAQRSYDVLEDVKKTPGLENLPIIVFTGKNLSHVEEMKIRKYADSIVVKTAHSYQRILDEVSLFLHLVEENKRTGKVFKYKKMGETAEVLKGKTVLIADDDVRNIFSLTKSLENYGMKVLSAIDGKEAVQQLEENPRTDIVLMDMMMPEMDGYESTRLIRQVPKFKNLPIIAVTAKAMTGDREKCISAGASDYITKPVDVDQLVSLLRVWLYE
ncbi:MAG: response regulator [Flavisolibacter sp.]